MKVWSQSRRCREQVKSNENGPNGKGLPKERSLNVKMRIGPVSLFSCLTIQTDCDSFTLNLGLHTFYLYSKESLIGGREVRKDYGNDSQGFQFRHLKVSDLGCQGSHSKTNAKES